MRPKRGQPGDLVSGSGRNKVKTWLVVLVVVTMLLQAAGVLGAGCTGTTPAHSSLCHDDDKGFIGTRTRVLAASCTPGTYCQYTCDTYYKKSGNSCVPNVCTGTIPAAPAALCTGDDSQLTTDTPRALEYYCSEAKKCEYYCSLAGSVKEGNSCVTLTSCTAANTRLVGWWRGEQNFNDASPNLLQGTGSGVDFFGGKVGSAFRFDSSGSDVMTVPDANVLDIIGTLTLELWIKPTQAGDKQIIRKMVGSPTRGYGLVMTADRHIKFWINGVTISSDFPVELNDWTHVAAVYSPDSYMKIYLDGIPHGVKDTGVPASMEANSAALKIGGGVSGQHFFGSLDEISIYNQALDVSEIQHIVAAAQQGKCLFAESACTDGLDNDEDGKTDCADSTCVGYAGDTAGHLCEAVEGNCADGFDNDGDGSADIADVTNCNKGKGCTKSDGTAGEIVWTYYLPNQQTQANAGTAPQLSQRGCCGSGQSQCASEAGCTNKYTLTADPQWICGDNNNFNRCATATAGTNVGDYTCQNNQWLVPELCANGLDDNNDGFTDCLDTQCATDATACLQSCFTTPAGVQAWWKGESNAQDASGNGRGATLGSSTATETTDSTPTFTTIANGVVGQAIHFDGGDLFRMADSENLNFGKSNAFTLEAWVKTASGSGTIMGKKAGSSGAYRGYALYLNDGYLKADINTGSSSYFLAKRSAQKINTNKWVHVAMSYDGSGLLSGLQLYINGEKLEGADLNYQDGNNDLDNTGTNIQNTLPFKLGSYGGPTVADSNEKFTGDIDEPAVYNQALSSAKVKDIYRSGLQGKCPPEDCTTPADDDNDGNANCADADCQGTAACVETECNDNADNDLDGTVDCLDSDCNGGTPGSTPAANCQKVPCTFLPEGLISWWAADGNELDSANNNHAQRGSLPGADSADPAFTSSGVITGKAFSFDGGDFLQVANEENFDFSFAESFSLESWFKSSATTGTKPIFNKRAATGSGYTLALSNGRLKFLIASTAGQTIAQDTSASYADNSWHHVIVTYDGSRLVSGMTMYVDGSQVGTSATGAIPAAEEIQNNEPLLIGKWAGNFYNGVQDELAVYERTLAASEVGILYRKGIAGQHRCLEKCDNSVNDDEDSQIDGKDSECENKQCDNEGRVGVASSLEGNTFYGCCFGGGDGECVDSIGTCFTFDTLTTVTASGNLDNKAVCASNNDFQLCSTDGEISADRHYYCYQQQWRECNSANVQLVGKQQEFKCVQGRWVTFLDTDADSIPDNLEGSYVQIIIDATVSLSCVNPDFPHVFESVTYFSTAPPAAVYTDIYEFLGCLKGDLTNNGVVDGDDISPFIAEFQNQEGQTNVISRGDINQDSQVNGDDISPFVAEFQVNNP